MISDVVKKNFQAARQLVERQATRSSRGHLLAAMDVVLQAADALDARQAPAEPAKLYRGHIDPDCEVYREVGAFCTCETPEEKAERARECAEIEAEQEKAQAPAEPPADLQETIAQFTVYSEHHKRCVKRNSYPWDKAQCDCGYERWRARALSLLRQRSAGDGPADRADRRPDRSEPRQG